MVRIFEVKQLEAKKRALAAESEVYRQTLKLEVQNLRLYALGVKHKFTSFRSNPLLLLLPLAAPALGKRLLGIFFPSGRRRSHWRRRLLTALFGFQVARKAGPFLRHLFGYRPEASYDRHGEEQTPAGDI